MPNPAPDVLRAGNPAKGVCGKKILVSILDPSARAADECGCSALSIISAALDGDIESSCCVGGRVFSLRNHWQDPKGDTAGGAGGECLVRMAVGLDRVPTHDPCSSLCSVRDARRSSL